VLFTPGRVFLAISAGGFSFFPEINHLTEKTIIALPGRPVFIQSILGILFYPNRGASFAGFIVPSGHIIPPGNRWCYYATLLVLTQEYSNQKHKLFFE
jgi:hypothetical protein